MSTSSSPLPYLPLEVEHQILRFCDPSTLAETAQGSLAFLELSSPILYEDVHIHGIEALTALFSPRTQPPSLQIAPFLSLSQILNLTMSLPIQALQPSSETLRHLSLDRSPSTSPLLLRQLQISAISGKPPECDKITLFPLIDLLDPLHLSLRAPPSFPTRYIAVQSLLWTRLESLTLGSLTAGLPLFKRWPSRRRPHLALVTYQIDEAGVEVDRTFFHHKLICMLEDQPMPEGVQVVVVVTSEEARTEVLDQLRQQVELGRYGSAGNRVLAQTTVEIKQT